MISSKLRYLGTFCTSKKTCSNIHNNVIIQGKASVYKNFVYQSNGQTYQNQAFYNPVQIFNRDCTILAIQTFINLLKQQKGAKFTNIKIIDALSASGLRAIRYSKQLENVQVIYANDISSSAYKLMEQNIKLNQIYSQKLVLSQQDTNLLLHNLKNTLFFDVIDIDPYGSSIPFLDASFTNINDGGLLCTTFTDTRVLCGPDFTKCIYYYGVSRAKVQHYSQNAIRIAINTVNSIANKHYKYIQPLISIYDGFYLRIFMKVKHGKKQSAQSSLNIGNLYYCNSCGNYQYSPLYKSKQNGSIIPNKIEFQTNICPICQDNYYLNGPIWLGNINDINFINAMIKTLENNNNKLFQLKTQQKISGNLRAIKDEKQLSTQPLGFCLNDMCKLIKSPIFSKKILFAAVESLGYKIAESYLSPNIFKTNAKTEVLYDIIKSWKIKEVGQQNMSKGVTNKVGLKILQKPIANIPNFNFSTNIPKNIRFQAVSEQTGPLKKVSMKNVSK